MVPFIKRPREVTVFLSEDETHDVIEACKQRLQFLEARLFHLAEEIDSAELILCVQEEADSLRSAIYWLKKFHKETEGDEQT